MAERIHQLVINSDIRNQMGTCCRKKVHDRHHVITATKGIIKTIENLIAKQRPN
ncbi:MAG: hypothetical protein ACKVOW_21120 [Chitinophagaceae bacterium]